MTSSLTSPPNVTDARRLGLPNIALVGKAGAGKTTGAELLRQLGYLRRSFAGPLKDIAAQLWGEAARTDRDKLQRLGVAVREIEADTWSDLLVRHLHLSNAFGPFVVDDLRFGNEWWALRAEGFVIVRVTAGRAHRIDRLKANGKLQDEGQLTHVSETAVDHLNADYTIENNGSTDDYYDRLVDVVIKERKRR